MKLRLTLAAVATAVAVLFPAVQGSGQSVAASDTAATATQSTPIEVHAAARFASSAEPVVPVTSATPRTSTTSTSTTRTGNHSVLIMMVNWTKADSVTPAAAQAQVGVTTNNWYKAVSFGKLSFSAKATPWMELAKQDCTLETGGYWKLLTAAEKAATAHGYNPKAYDHEMVYFPYDAKCNYGGLGAVNQRAVWVNGEMDSRVTFHELGHNLGLNHGRTAICIDKAGRQATASANCTLNEYGDIFNTMAVPVAGTPQFSAIQLNQLGWLTSHVTTVIKSGFVALAPLASGSGTLAARIRVGGTEYWLEYRQPVGVDAPLRATAGGLDGVLIHQLGTDGGSNLLDARPDSTKSFTNAALPVGRSFTAPQHLTVKVNSRTSSRIVVSITMPK